MKTCPFCAETDLKDAAMVCRHCGRDISTGLVGRERKMAILALTLVLGVLALGAGTLAMQFSNPDLRIVDSASPPATSDR